MVIKFSFTKGSAVHPVPKNCDTLLLIFNRPSCWAIPVAVATNVLPALFHCQEVVEVCPLKYSSITILPFTRIINDFVCFCRRNSFNGCTALSFHSKLEIDFVSHTASVFEGKYIASPVPGGVSSSFLLQPKIGSISINRIFRNFINEL